MKKVILFDIDYTLFNTASFKKDIFKKIGNYLKKTDINKLDQIYSESRNEVGYFDPRSFVRKINEELKVRISENFLDKNVDPDDLIKHIYPDAKDILEKLKKEKNYLVGIFSGGRIGFQKNKIKAIKHLFDKDHIHIFLKKNKDLKKVLEKYKEHKLYLIDDYREILDMAKKINENVITILIRREGSEFKEIQGKIKHDLEVKKLSNLFSILRR